MSTLLFTSLQGTETNDAEGCCKTCKMRYVSFARNTLLSINSNFNKKKMSFENYIAFYHTPIMNLHASNISGQPKNCVRVKNTTHIHVKDCISIDPIEVTSCDGHCGTQSM